MRIVRQEDPENEKLNWNHDELKIVVQKMQVILKRKNIKRAIENSNQL